MRWTEAVARKEKVCPMTMRVTDDGRYQSHQCVASDCMAWRGTQHTSPNVTVRIVNPPDSNVPVHEVKIPAEDIAKAGKGVGFCGLAGLPY